MSGFVKAIFVPLGVSSSVLTFLKQLKATLTTWSSKNCAINGSVVGKARLLDVKDVPIKSYASKYLISIFS